MNSFPGSPETESRGPESRGGAWRIFMVPAVLALVGYVALYALDAHMRTHKGPWEITFQTEPDGTPAVSIAQRFLGVSNVVVRFAGESIPGSSNLPPVTVRMTRPEETLAPPFGKVAFHDLIYQPGTVVLHCFGHEVQMLPRGLYLNRQENGWDGSARYELKPGEKLPTLDPPTPSRPPLMIPSLGPMTTRPESGSVGE